MNFVVTFRLIFFEYLVCISNSTCRSENASNICRWTLTNQSIQSIIRGLFNFNTTRLNSTSDVEQTCLHYIPSFRSYIFFVYYISFCGIKRQVASKSQYLHILLFTSRVLCFVFLPLSNFYFMKI